jgi:multidrug efflux pump subunit AcrA (membrane-fusion protein)
MTSRISSKPGRSGFTPLRVFLLSAGFLALAAGCSQKEPEVAPEVSVQVTPAKTGEISQLVTAEAVVFPLQQAVVTPKITSTIKSFAVQRGSRVRKGQLLAVLENADLSAAAVQSKGEYEQAEASYVTSTAAGLPQQIQKAELDTASAKSALDAQQKIYDSRKELFDQGAVPRRDLDAAQVALVQARSQWEQAQKQLDDLRRVGKEQALKTAGGQLSAAKGKLLSAEAQLSYSEIRSPIDGVVTDRPQFPGELASANQPLLTVMNTSHLIAKSHIAQAQAVALKVGDRAEIHIAGVDDPVPAKVSLVSPALDPGSTTIEVWVETAKPPSELKPGTTVEVLITAATAKGAILVPKSSVFETAESGPFVLIAGKDGLAHQTSVQLGLRGTDDTQIVKGVSAGDSIITIGSYSLPDKTKIKIEASAAESDKADNKAVKEAGEKSGDQPGAKPGAKSPAAPEKE